MADITNDDKTQVASNDSSGGSNDSSSTTLNLTAADVMPNQPQRQQDNSASSQSQPGKPSMGDVADASIERSLGGGGASTEQQNLGDLVFAPPSGNYTHAARELTVQANLTEGRVTVTNMSLTVNGQELRGPVSYTRSGQNFIIDESSKQKYLLLPQSDEHPNGAIVPVQRGQPLGSPEQITSQRIIQGFGDGGSYSPFQPAKPAAPATTAGDSAVAAPPQVAAPAMAANNPGGQSAWTFNNFTPTQWQTYSQLQGQGAFALRPDGGFARPDLAINAASELGLKPTDLALISQLKNPNADQLQQQLQQMHQTRSDAGVQQQQQPQVKLSPEQLAYLQQQLTQNPQLMQQLIQSGDPRANAILEQLQHKGMLPGREGHDTAAGAAPAEAMKRQQATEAANVSRNLEPLLANPAARTAVLDALGKALEGRPLFLKDQQSARQWDDVLNALGPERLSQLRLLFQDGKPLSGEANFDMQSQLRLREFLELVLLATRQNREQAQTAPGFSALDWLSKNESMRGLDRIPDVMTSRIVLGEFVKAIQGNERDLNLRELIARGLNEPGNAGPIDGRGFLVRTDEASLRALIDRAHGRQESTEGPAIPANRSDVNPSAGEPDSALRTIISNELATKAEDDLQGVKTSKPDEMAVPAEADPAAEAALAALAAKKRKQMEEKEEEDAAARKTKRDDEKRQRYVVKERDTLETIAAKALRDRRLAGLIYDINKAVIPVKTEGGRKTPQLKPGMMLWLPTSTEVRDYRVRLMGGTVPSAATTPQPGHASAEDELTARFGKNWSAESEPQRAAAVDADTARSGVVEPESEPINEDADGTSQAADTEAESAAEAQFEPEPEAASDMEDAARADYQSRRARIESLLGPLGRNVEGVRPKYVVRLGDTLKSIAMKHPALNDVTLWKLLAEVNNLPVDVDAKGNPIAAVKRGQTLNLPVQEQIDAFRRRGSSQQSAGSALARNLETRACPRCSRMTLSTAAICPACGEQFEPSLPDPPPDVVRTRVPNPRHSATRLRSLKATGEPRGKSEPASAAGGGAEDKVPNDSKTTVQHVIPSTPDETYKLVADFDGRARIMQAGNPNDTTIPFKFRLEIATPSGFLPVVSYEVLGDVSLRHQFLPDGQCKTIRIDLPPSASVELAQNDLTSNWVQYCDKFARTQPAG